MMNLVKCRRSNAPKVKAKTRSRLVLMNLPSDIVVEILSRLPATDVTKSKLVCRKWLNIFSTLEFVKLHRSRTDPCLVAFHPQGPEFSFRIFDFDDANGPVLEFRLSVFPEIPRCLYSTAALVSSVDGLICFRYSNYFIEQIILFVCNPVTRDYVVLPMFQGPAKAFQFMVHGFGRTISGQYKAVRIRHNLARDETTGAPIGITQFECCVHTLGTDSWRMIGGGVPSNKYAYCDTLFKNGLFLNGNLHWLIVDFEGGCDLISCFDLDKESFHPFPPPFAPSEYRDDNFCLGVVKGCLCLCDNTSKSDIVIWVMKEYGVQESWTKDFVINKKLPCCSGTLTDYKITPLEIFQDGDILFSAHKDSDEYNNDDLFVAYSNESKTVRVIDKNFRYTMTMRHVSSFFSLKSFVPEKVRMFEDLHQDKFNNTKVQG